MEPGLVHKGEKMYLKKGCSSGRCGGRGRKGEFTLGPEGLVSDHIHVGQMNMQFNSSCWDSALTRLVFTVLKFKTFQEIHRILLRDTFPDTLLRTGEI